MNVLGSRKSRIMLIPRLYGSDIEAYSWGVGEYDSEDGVDGGSEGCVGAAVVGVKDAPGFQLRDTSFYEVADSVDFLVELLFTVV